MRSLGSLCGASGSAGRAAFFLPLLGACYQWPDVEHDALPGTNPTITSASVTCDERAATWLFEVGTDAWTGNGIVYLSADGAYIETHSLLSTTSAADGSSDTLERSLVIVASWRDVTTNASTAFGCATPALAGVLEVYERTGDARTDCVAFGVDPTRWATWTPDAACEEMLTQADTGVGDTGGDTASTP